METEKYYERYEKAVDLIRMQAHEKIQQELFLTATEFVVETRRISISAMQRVFRIGYNQAANLVEKLESEKIVSKPDVKGTRTVLIR